MKIDDVREYYTKLANTHVSLGLGDNWVEYYTQLANWDKVDNFHISSADFDCPIFTYFRPIVGDIMFREVLFSVLSQWGGYDYGTARKLFFSLMFMVIWCERTSSHYLAVGYVGGCEYEKVNICYALNSTT